MNHKWEWIPEELKALKQWMAWNLEPNPDPKKKLRKVPKNPHTGHEGKTDDLSTWGTIEEALRCATERKFTGIGFVFTKNDPYVGIDLDKCRNSETGEIESWALEVIERFNSYTEVSQSETGIHIIIKGKLPLEGRRKGQIEMYETGRYFAMGTHMEGTPKTIEDRSQELTTWHREVFEPKKQTTKQTIKQGSLPLDDQAIIEKARKAQNGALFDRLWRGDTSEYPSQSEADLALCGLLAFWTGGDRMRIDSLFRQSGLYRGKWDRDDYQRDTINKALEGKTEFYTSNRQRQSQSEQTNTEKEKVASTSEGYHLTDMGNGYRLVKRHGENIRYCYAHGSWYVWNGSRWWKDDVGKICEWAKETVLSMYSEAATIQNDFKRKELVKHAKQSEGAKSLKAMLEMAQCERAVRVKEFDTDLWLFNTLSGTVDLRTGELREHRREDLITKIATIHYDPNATCPIFEKFLNRIMDGVQEMIDFLQRAVGYSLTGSVREQVLFFLYGGGKNGKSTFIHAILDMMGDYAIEAAPDILIDQKFDRHPTEIADLMGKRLVSTIEVAEGKRLAEVRTKQLTGGDRLKGRFMRQDFFEFESTFKLWLAGNHKPVIHGTDDAIWRRIKLIPFEVRIPDAECDPNLPEKLRQELPGILAWAVRGCLAWQKDGLKFPDKVTKASEAYRAEQDILAEFLLERCFQSPSAFVPVGELHSAYTKWALETGEKHPLSQRMFGMRLKERGFEQRRGAKGIWHWFGIGLVTSQHDSQADNGNGTDENMSDSSEYEGYI